MPCGMQRPPKVRHIIEIDRWRFDYYFGVNDVSVIDKAYLDHRSIEIEGPIVEPVAIKAKKAKVTLTPSDGLIEAAKQSKRRFGDRLGASSEPREISPVGYVHYRSAEYSANLFFPSDMLQPILIMLWADQYKYVLFEAAKGGNDAAIYNFELLKRRRERTG